MKFTLMILVFITCGTSAWSADKIKPLTIAMIQEWTQFNPVNVNVAATQALMQFVIRDMVMRDSAGNLIPDLSSEIPTVKNKRVHFITENGSRKIVADWTIKATAKWGNGSLVTCEDWWMGWQAGLSPNVSTTEKHIYSKIQKMEWSKDQPNNCKVTYENDDWTFDRDLPTLLPKHLEAAVFEKWKDKSEAYDQNSNYVKNPTLAGLYNGPYLISEFKLGSHIILKPNPSFYGEKPTIENIIIKLISDTSALRSMLSSGAIDIISANGFPADSAIVLDQESQKGKTPFVVKFQSSSIFQGLFFNLENEFLKDPAVRKALSLAINKKELTDAFFQGKISPAESMYSVQSPAYQNETAIYNPALARKTLENAGWKLNQKSGSEKIFEKNGKELALEFRTSSGIKVLETIQTAICSHLSKVGIRCIIKNQPPRVFLGESVPHGDFSLAMFGQPIQPDSSMTGTFSSKEIPTEKNGWTGQNIFRWKSPKVDELLLKFDKEWNPSKRIKLAQAIEREVQKDLPFTPIYHRKEAFVLPRNLSGFSEDISSVNFAFPEKWRLQ